MLTSNHILAGSTIALSIRQPILVVPLALLSHYLLDMLPHFGYHRGGYRELFTHRLTYAALVLDVMGITTLLVILAPLNWLLVVVLWASVLPDLIWPYRYFYYERLGKPAPETGVTRLHNAIQWCERPWGLAVEIAFFVAGIYLLQAVIMS